MFWWRGDGLRGRVVMGLGAAGAIGAAGAAVSAGTSIASAVGGGSQQSSDISQGQQQANQAEQQAYTDYKTNEAPFLDTGSSAVSAYGNAAGLNGAAGTAQALSDFQASPGYQYQLQQGLSAIDNGAASNGTLRSGNTIRAEESLGSNLANQDFSQYASRLSNLATLGQTAASSLGSAALSSASQIAGTDTSAATSQANIAGSTAKGISNAVSGLAGNSSITSALSNLGGSGNTNYNAGLAGTVNGTESEAIV